MVFPARPSCGGSSRVLPGQPSVLRFPVTSSSSNTVAFCCESSCCLRSRLYQGPLSPDSQATLLWTLQPPAPQCLVAVDLPWHRWFLGLPSLLSMVLLGWRSTFTGSFRQSLSKSTPLFCRIMWLVSTIWKLNSSPSHITPLAHLIQEHRSSYPSNNAFCFPCGELGKGKT